MALPNRKTLRADLMAKLKTITILADEAGGQAHVFDYLVKNPGGISPFACIDAVSAAYHLNNDEGRPTQFVLMIGFWARRDTTSTDGADDTLDDLAVNMATVIDLIYNARFISASQTDYEEIDGVPYKFELHFIEFDV